MRIRVRLPRREFEPVIQLLDIAINDYSHYEDNLLRIIVRDAKLLANDKQRYFYTVDRKLLLYSRELTKFDRKKLMAMDSDNLQVTDYIEINSFFKNRR